MQGKPWMKFFCRDWRADGRLKLCSLTACGLWVDLLTLMHDEGDPYGHLCIAGKVLKTPAEIASAIGRQVKEVRKPLEELQRHGVPSFTEEGCLYSRRMVRDEETRRKRAEGGKLGGNPALIGESKDNLPDNLHPGSDDNFTHARERALASGLSSSAVEVGEEVTATPKSPPSVKRAERDRHLLALEGVAPGFTEAWDSWRAALPSTKRWTLWSEVLKLRTFREISTRCQPAEILDMAVMGASRMWQGFEEEWWKQQRENNGSRTFGPSSARRPPTPGSDESRRQRAAELDRQLGLGDAS